MINVHISYVKTKRHKNMTKMFAVVTFGKEVKVTSQVYTNERLYLEIADIKKGFENASNRTV